MVCAVLCACATITVKFSVNVSVYEQATRTFMEELSRYLRVSGASALALSSSRYRMGTVQMMASTKVNTSRFCGNAVLPKLSVALRMALREAFLEGSVVIDQCELDDSCDTSHNKKRQCTKKIASSLHVKITLLILMLLSRHQYHRSPQ